jgi:tetratricopeptide (TPR) repeat protein
MLYFAGQMDELVRVCDEGIRIDPTKPLYFFLKGKVLAKEGRTQEALDALRRAQALHPAGQLGSDVDRLIQQLAPAP